MSKILNCYKFKFSLISLILHVSHYVKKWTKKCRILWCNFLNVCSKLLYTLLTLAIKYILAFRTMKLISEMAETKLSAITRLSGSETWKKAHGLDPQMQNFVLSTSKILQASMISSQTTFYSICQQPTYPSLLETSRLRSKRQVQGSASSRLQFLKHRFTCF